MSSEGAPTDGGATRPRRSLAAFFVANTRAAASSRVPPTAKNLLGGEELVCPSDSPSACSTSRGAKAVGAMV